MHIGEGDTSLAWRNRTLALALLVAASGLFPPILVGILGVQIQARLAFGEAALGGAISIFFLTAGIASVVAGRLVDHLGWSRSTRLAAGISAAAMAGIAVAARSWVTLVLFLVVGGIGHALAMPASNLALAREMLERRRALMFGVKQAAVPGAVLLAGLSLPLIALRVGWRWVFVTALILPVGVMLLAPLGGTTRHKTGEARRLKGSARASGPMIQLGIAGAVAAATSGALAAFYVVSVVDSGLLESHAGVLVAVATAVGLAVRVLAGWIIDTQRWDGFAAVALLLSVGSLGFAGLVLDPGIPLVLASILAFGAGWGWPGLFHFAVVDANLDRAGAATGIVQTGLSIGAASGPILFGLAAQWWSFDVAWLGVAACGLVAGVMMHSPGKSPTGGFWTAR